MRRIIKNSTPDCLRKFIDAQLGIQPEPVNVAYGHFTHKSVLRSILTEEQYGLCGYTGAPVDSRISQLQSTDDAVSFRNHIEHLKCQQACRTEVTANGQVYGRVLGEDLDYRNMIAALEVRGAEAEQFGAVVKANHELPVLPTHDACSERFFFREGDGVIEGVDGPANQSIQVLDLNHETLKRWRSSAIAAWLDPEVIEDVDDLRDVLLAVTEPRDGRLPEFAFVLESITKQYVDEAHF